MLQEGCPVETKSAQRQAFAHYLRTGRRPELELKFNPYHDPRNGQFTFAPGGPRSLSYVVVSKRKQPMGGGGNYRAFWTPMTLQQVSPRLRNAPAGAIVAVAGNLLEVWGPGDRLTASLTQQYSDTLIAQIQEIDPTYRFASLGSPATLQGQINQINRLRMDRAAILYPMRG